MSDTYTTIQDDMWDSMAKKLYGTEQGMNALIEANPAMRRMVVFPAGVVITVPDYEKSKTSRLPPWRRS